MLAVPFMGEIENWSWRTGDGRTDGRDKKRGKEKKLEQGGKEGAKSNNFSSEAEAYVHRSMQDVLALAPTLAFKEGRGGRTHVRSAECRRGRGYFLIHSV